MAQEKAVRFIRVEGYDDRFHLPNDECGCRRLATRSRRLCKHCRHCMGEKRDRSISRARSVKPDDAYSHEMRLRNLDAISSKECPRCAQVSRRMSPRGQRAQKTTQGSQYDPRDLSPRVSSPIAATSRVERETSMEGTNPSKGIGGNGDLERRSRNADRDAKSNLQVTSTGSSDQVKSRLADAVSRQAARILSDVLRRRMQSFVYRQLGDLDWRNHLT